MLVSLKKTLKYDDYTRVICTSFQMQNSMPSLYNYQQTSNNMFMLILALVIAITFPHCDADDATITIPNVGTLSYTSTTSSWSSKNIFQFRGVRFAESPTGIRRFKVCLKNINDFLCLLLVEKVFCYK